MKFDEKEARKLDSKSARKILLKGGLIFDIIGLILIILGLLSLIGGSGASSLILIIPGLILLILGMKNLFLKGNKRERYLTSKLVAMAIKENQKNGKVLTKEEQERIKFEYDPIFHNKDIFQVDKDKYN